MLIDSDNKISPVHFKTSDTSGIVITNINNFDINDVTRTMFMIMRIIITTMTSRRSK